MLIKPDFDQIKKLIREEVRKQIKHLPTKDEFYKAMDKLMGRFDKVDKEMAAIGFRTKDHEERIEILEKIHPSDQHAF